MITREKTSRYGAGLIGKDGSPLEEEVFHQTEISIHDITQGRIPQL